MDRRYSLDVYLIYRHTLNDNFRLLPTIQGFGIEIRRGGAALRHHIPAARPAERAGGEGGLLRPRIAPRRVEGGRGVRREARGGRGRHERLSRVRRRGAGC